MTDSLGWGGVIQFAKAPIPGQVKTRMSALLSSAQSCELHRRLCVHTANACCQPGDWHYALYVTQPSHRFWADAFCRLPVHGQCAGDLGRRMAQAIQEGLARGWCWVALIGSDCPALSAKFIEQARAALAKGRDLVLVPASDGGYVLIAMRKPLALFDGIEWGSDKVLQQTLMRAKSLGLDWQLLAPLDDIDRPQDLEKLGSWPELADFMLAQAGQEAF